MARAVRCDGSAASVSELTRALAEALHGGPAVLPFDGSEPGRGVGDEPGRAALLVETSGSTGEAKRVALSATALRASAAATHARLGGPGRWLLALPALHIAGVQVVVRALLAGQAPAALDLRGGFRAAGFVSATDALVAESPDQRRYTALVPTQLHRLLAAGGPALDALRRFDAVLVGGAATPPALLAETRAAGVAAVTTYGMSETAGGCVYDGVPLEGVRVRLDRNHRIWLTGPTLADGYLGDPARTTENFVDGWFRTCDLGAWDGERLRVLGRVDDVITTGGLKVHPAAVERVLTSQPGVRGACVVGLDDPEWGQRVAAAVVPADPGTLDRARLVKAVRAQLGRPSAPRQLRVVRELPARGIGKTDRVAVARLLAERAAHATVTTAATLGEWVSGARPRTLPNAVAPVLVGTGAAVGAGGFAPLPAGLSLVVAVALTIGVNFANDYSDGVRGADTARTGALRLVGSGTATPAAVRAMALAWLAAALLAGAAVVAVSGRWWLLGVGAGCLLGAWCYTGGPRPYGYRGYGEVAVFVFFGPVAVLGTAYVQRGPPMPPALVASVGVGLLCAAVLTANNLRDIHTDPAAGKRTLAVILGATGCRRLYAALIVAPLVLSAAAGALSPPLLLGLAAAPLAVPPVRAVLRARPPAPVLNATVTVLITWSVGTALGLAVG